MTRSRRPARRLLPPVLALAAAAVVLPTATSARPPAETLARPGNAPVPDVLPADTLPADTLHADGWNSARVRRLVREAVEARRHGWSDSTLASFRARARGHIYFLGSLAADDAAPGQAVDRLVRADQVALRIRWQAPGRSQQVLVGRRGERRLPTRVHYHVDHLTAVMENFGDRISMGEGTEVRDVVHPVSPEGLELYDYRLADSLGMRVAGRETEIYRVQVRPAGTGTAAVVGAVHLEARSRAVVRLRVTFTPAAYRDPSLQRITVDLESALWEGRWWLPARQTTTVRRSSRWLDLPVSSVIRTRLRIFDYEINPDRPIRLAPGHRVLTLPDERLQTFDDWEQGLYAGLADGGRGAAEDAASVRRRARSIARERLLAGGSRLAPAVPALSEIFRARRAEGARAGLGWRFRLDDARSLAVRAGHRFAGGGMSWRAAWSGPLAGPVDLELEAYGDRLTDVGPWAGAAGLVSTLGFVVRGEDFTDPWYRSGGSAGAVVPVGDSRLRLGLTVESHRRATAVAEPPGDDPVRPVRPVDGGELVGLSAAWREPLGRSLGTDWSAEIRAEGATGAIGDFGFTRILARMRARSGPAAAPWAWRLDAAAGLGGGDLPPQRLLLVGGRGTVPGYAFRSWGGDRAGWVRLGASRELLGPWISLRAVAAAGWAEVAGPGAAAAGSFGGARGGRLHGSGGVRPSAGAGVGLVDGLLRVEVVRGFDGGRWEWMVSVDPRLRGIL